MKSAWLTGAAALAMMFGTVAAHAAGGGSGGPVITDPDPDPGVDPSDPGAGGGGDPGTGTGGGTTTQPAATGTYSYGSGALVFSLDSLPTGASGTQAFYQPAQDYTSIGQGTIASAQGGLTQTVGGTTLSLSTATYVEGTSDRQTRIRVENDSSNFGYLGVPAGVGVGIEATTLATTSPGAIFVNFTNALSYFSVNLYRLSGAFDVTSVITAYSGLDGTGTVLGQATGSITGGNNFAYSTVELANLAGARSFTLLGGSALANYDAITATVAGVPEPASWAMMVGGFGLVGAALRRRRVRVAYA